VIVNLTENLVQRLGRRRPDLDARVAAIALLLTDKNILDNEAAAAVRISSRTLGSSSESMMWPWISTTSTKGCAEDILVLPLVLVPSRSIGQTADLAILEDCGESVDPNRQMVQRGLSSYNE